MSPARPLPFVVARIDYTPASNDETGRIFVELKANSKGELATVQLRISAGDIVGKTVAGIFAAKGFLRETPELIAAYDANARNYFEWRSHYGAQFSGGGLGFFAEDPTSSHRSNDWTRKDSVILSSGGNPARLVNDESLLANSRADAGADRRHSRQLSAQGGQEQSLRGRGRSRGGSRPRSARICSGRFRSIPSS